MSSPSSSRTSPSNVERLQNARKALTSTKHYLANPNASNELTWVAFGKEDCIVPRESGESFKAAYEAHKIDPDAHVPDPPERATLSAVVFVTADDYWLTSCGMWKGPTSVAKTMADVKPTCTGESPQQPIFANDFPTVMTNVDNLIAKTRRNDQMETKGIFKNDSKGQRKLKFRHILFEEIAEDGEGSSTTLDTDNDIPVDFTISGWPAHYIEAQEALADMVDTHRVNYLEAYDVAGKLINPASYRKYLQGAVIQIHFTLSHWYIIAKGRSPSYDAFAANISYIRVLVPPSPIEAPSPRKRKFNLFDPSDPDLSPSSKKGKNPMKRAIK